MQDCWLCFKTRPPTTYSLLKVHISQVRNSWNSVRLFVGRLLYGSDHARTAKVKSNVLRSIAFRGISVGASLVIVPITLDYLDPTKYGIWLTLSSILGWLSFFDIGLGNGLRNKLAEALAKHEEQKAKVYVSTAYGVLTGIAVVIFLVFLIVNPLLKWTAILNTPNNMENELSTLTLIVLAFLSIRFVSGLIGMVSTANQEPSVSTGLEALAGVLTVLAIVILKMTTLGSLLYLGGSATFISAAVPLIAGTYLYKRRYKGFSPSITFIKLSYARDLASLGIKFFILQMVFIVVFAANNVIIAQLFGPADVTAYNIAFKYFYFVTMVFTIMTMPLWSAFTDAYVKEDYAWIRSVVNKTIRVWGVLACIALVMLLLSTTAYKLWVGERVVVPFLLSSTMCLFVLLTTWNGVFTLFVNGVGKIRLQLTNAILVGLACIPLSIFFAKVLQMGSAGVVLGTVVCLVPGSIITPIQYYKIINKKATGIWDR